MINAIVYNQLAPLVEFSTQGDTEHIGVQNNIHAYIVNNTN